ncbi:zinc finger FYVE domain-containing protein 21-like [Mizuhopecten yessoensis]|uniref:Zinc finger FYVE domain-containing protein 21 n=1 Tax=Mizuhopecten yessoensis TaxID=6573 RepID=A0A210PXJ2_MIZYE|nr:zinc finger FYVE domain-containing protein 21-like [Mizuhopecten yessoensis]OWF41179.1 Zinc finger FYVE domain-containing protein 21 [Mizuhopecten yessoensis]
MSAPEKKLVRSKSGLRMVPVNYMHSSPFTVNEPPWVPDNECVVCMNSSCKAKFDFRRRRHHCRRCGRCFCSSCCDFKVPLNRMCFVDPVRQCNVCVEISRKENDFFDKHLKTLCNGGDFVLKESGDEIDDSCSTFRCKLSTDNRTVTFDSNHDKHQPIQMEKLESVQILTNGVDAEGNMVATGIAMKYNSHSLDKNMVKLVINPSSTNKREGQMWIAAMQKAFKLIHEARMMDRP